MKMSLAIVALVASTGFASANAGVSQADRYLEPGVVASLTTEEVNKVVSYIHSGKSASEIREYIRDMRG